MIRNKIETGHKIPITLYVRPEKHAHPHSLIRVFAVHWLVSKDMRRVKTNQTVRIRFAWRACNFVGIAMRQLKLRPERNQLHSIEPKSHALNI